MVATGRIPESVGADKVAEFLFQANRTYPGADLAGAGGQTMVMALGGVAGVLGSVWDWIRKQASAIETAAVMKTNPNRGAYRAPIPEKEIPPPPPVKTSYRDEPNIDDLLKRHDDVTGGGA